MHLGLVLDMASSGYGERIAVVANGESMSYEEIARLSWAATERLVASDATSVLYLGSNHLSYPVALFGAAGAGIPFIPLNYRLGAAQLSAQIEAHPGAYVIYEGEPPALGEGMDAVERNQFIAQMRDVSAEPAPEQDTDLTCILLYTSGTTAAPKAAVLRHRHLMSYLFSSVEFAGAEEDDAALVSVPPYHIAGVANLLSNFYAGRRIVYLDRFDPEIWLETVRREQVTQAMVIPTMLSRIVDALDGEQSAQTPSLRALSYGGSRMPLPVLERALSLFPETGFVNAYGLTETSSTIALLGPDDHRDAFSSSDPVLRQRLTSVGQLLPGIDVEVRHEDGSLVEAGEPGLVFLKGDQISGEYAGVSLLDDDGWFPTRDRGWIDADGYLFIEGRADDTIIRGGENIAPAEIEDVLISHDDVVDAVVIGLPDDEWGQRLVAVVVAGESKTIDIEILKELVKTQLRSSKTPEEIHIWDELPRTDTGKILRRNVVADLSGS